MSKVAFDSFSDKRMCTYVDHLTDIKCILFHNHLNSIMLFCLCAFKFCSTEHKDELMIVVHQFV